LPTVIELNPKRQLKKGQIAPYLDMKNMPTNSLRALDWREREFKSGTRFINGDVLLSRITPCLENGKTAFVDFLADGQVGWGSTEYIVLRSMPPLSYEYAYFLARNEDFRQHAITNMTGSSGRQRVPAAALADYSITIPSVSIIKEFAKYAESIMKKIKQQDEESRTLATIRDTLLPKLISGELRVPDAEKFVEVSR
jgi:type I restriction enzyme S subunit